MKPLALANTLAIFSFSIFAICIVWAALHQDSFVSFWNSWAHGFNLEILVPREGLQIITGQTIFGIVSFIGSGWISGYFIAWLYNQFSK